MGVVFNRIDQTAPLECTSPQLCALNDTLSSVFWKLQQRAPYISTLFCKRLVPLQNPGTPKPENLHFKVRKMPFWTPQNKSQSRKIRFSKFPGSGLTKCSQNPGLVNQFSATPRGQLNWTGPIAHGSDKKWPQKSSKMSKNARFATFEFPQNGLFGHFTAIFSGGPKWHFSDFKLRFWGFGVIFGVSGFRGSVASQGVCKLCSYKIGVSTSSNVCGTDRIFL